MWTQAGPHGGTTVGGLRVFAGIRQPGHDDEEITGMIEDVDDDEPMPPLVSGHEDTDDNDSPLPQHRPVPIWHGPDTTPGRIMIQFFGPSRGPCRSPAGPWGFAKPGRQG
jgi:hypothetical protein